MYFNKTIKTQGLTPLLIEGQFLKKLQLYVRQGLIHLSGLFAIGDGVHFKNYY
jgi:hypothetical protein